MDLTLDEHKLLAEFRRLSPAGKDELLGYAGLLLRKMEKDEVADEPVPQDRCELGKQREERPEITKEPIFTE